MELKEIYEELKDNFRLIALSAIVLGVVGVAFHYLVPKKYIATGSIMVIRSVEPSSGTEFSYEGYYAQLNARNYTETFIGLLESTDARRGALASLELPVTSESLRRAGRNVSIKKAAPQVVTIKIKRNTAEFVEEYWKALASSAAGFSNVQKKDGDPNISLLSMPDMPVVYEEYRNVYICALVGLLLGAFFSSFFVILRKYLD